MNIWQEEVFDFHEATDSTIGYWPELRDSDLRAKLIMEEAVETIAAMGYSVHASIDQPGIPGERAHREVGRFGKTYVEPNFADVIDGYCDLIYVILGSAVTDGIDLDPFFAEVHRANLDKLSGPKREDGKQLKPEGWKPPDIDRLLAEQVAYADVWRTLTNPVIETPA